MMSRRSLLGMGLAAVAAEGGAGGQDADPALDRIVRAMEKHRVQIQSVRCVFTDETLRTAAYERSIAADRRGDPVPNPLRERIDWATKGDKTHRRTPPATRRSSDPYSDDPGMTDVCDGVKGYSIVTYGPGVTGQANISPRRTNEINPPELGYKAGGKWLGETIRAGTFHARPEQPGAVHGSVRRLTGEVHGVGRLDITVAPSRGHMAVRIVNVLPAGSQQIVFSVGRAKRIGGVWFPMEAHTSLTRLVAARPRRWSDTRFASSRSR